jgi:hypothetical protein
MSDSSRYSISFETWEITALDLQSYSAIFPKDVAQPEIHDEFACLAGIRQPRPAAASSNSAGGIFCPGQGRPAIMSRADDPESSRSQHSNTAFFPTNMLAWP